MSPMFEPDYTLLSFLFATRFAYPEALLLLALLRAFLGRGASRSVALLCAAFAASIVLIVFAPGLNLQDQPWYPPAARAFNHAQGMTMLLTLSALFATTAVLPGRRHAWIDWVHLALFLALLGLWAVTLV